MDRPPVVARVEAEDVPACCVFDAYTRIWSMDAHWASDAQCERFQQPLLAHIITGQDYRVTATAPEYDIRAIRQRRLRYLGHSLRVPESRVVPDAPHRSLTENSAPDLSTI